MPEPQDLQTLSINTIRFLSADGVQQANSGHPGLPMGAAAMAYTVWTRHLRFNPHNPLWPGRDRFILSGGHGSMLLYSLLYLTGYPVSLEELKKFRQWGSITPGHPELHLTPGVETTTGPLGQGFANGVGMAIGLNMLAERYNRPGFAIFDGQIFGIVTDGDLMEGVAAESASLAGHLRLGRLIYLYDDNRISIEGSTDLAFTEDRLKRFEAYGWHIQSVEDGNDVQAIDNAIRTARQDPRPSIIACRTQIGYGLPTRAGTAKAHGEPPGEDELLGAKRQLGWPEESKFFVPEDVLAFFRQAVERGKQLECDWEQRLAEYRSSFPEQADALTGSLQGLLPEGWDQQLPEFPADAKGMATRVASGKVINVLAGKLPGFVGGSADLAPSTNTLISNGGSYQANNPGGRNLHFGVREHAMGAVVNGLATISGIIPYGATFLVFSDYMRPAVRISAISKLGSVWVFTHDSIGLGEDGPTHQPVEHLAALRAIPNLVVIRPADASETVEAWKCAIRRRSSPTALALTRQAVPTLDRSRLNPASGLQHGAYILTESGDGTPDFILMASGSEVSLVLAAGDQLASQGIRVRVVSFPSWELFAMQNQEYRDQILPPGVRCRLAVEAGITMGWERWVGDQGRVLGLNGYGASAPGSILFRELGFTVDHITEMANELIAAAEII
jgi:transketolase